MDDQLAPGFRFYPTEEELVSFYLRNKLQGTRVVDIDRVIPTLHIYDYSPWDLPQFAGERCHGDQEQWFFFVPRQERVARGGRPNRLTEQGYWKATGSPCFVYSSRDRVIGKKRSMVFYAGRTPHGRKTVWKMNEYKVLEFSEASYSNAANPQLWEELSLCRVYRKTNSLRAFERRPPPPDEVVEGHQLVAAHHQNVATTSQQNHPVADATNYSFDNSLSEVLRIANDNCDMAVDENEPGSWDLEWFDFTNF
ncbi:NAC domain-containing protein 90-like isoform X2 [Olea europaea var. sylvestris]|uniref:NAC domain-containing protein 90-like isoform X2 n=1 Tax=Olea europaea var. sylvestris TaxID=158386 RepID=UPI000C1D3464|nr:NAC domain-containing protein 90-like isoform X2 [Olea europaea var. sylvestris]